MELKKLHPMEIVERSLILEQLRKVNPRDLRAFLPKSVKTVKDIQLDKIFYTQVVDWEYLFFEVSTMTLQEIMSKFVPVKKSDSEIITS
jgi:hypothetical protein